MSYNTIYLSKEKKYEKYNLVKLTGHIAEEIDKRTGRYKIVGADNYIDNDFRNIDELLLLVFKSELGSKGFILTA